MRESKEDLERAAAIVSAHGHTELANELVEREDLNWEDVTAAGKGLHQEGEA